MASVANENGKLAKARAAVGDDYVPDDTEEYMNERQQQYVRVLLLEWKKYRLRLLEAACLAG